MLSLSAQVSANPEYLRKKSKHGQHQAGYSRSYYQKNRERLLSQRKLYYLNQKKQLWSNYYPNKKPYCSGCFQLGIKENQYKFCGQDCLVKHWISIYPQKEFGVTTKCVEQNTSVYPSQNQNGVTTIGVEQNGVTTKQNGVTTKFLSHTRSSLTIARDTKELFRGGGNCSTPNHSNLRGVIQHQTPQACDSTHKSERLFNIQTSIHTKKEELERRLDQGYLRLATKNKIAQKKGWNQLGFKECLTIAILKKKYGEYGLLGGKQVGNKYLSFLDIDIFKEDVPLTLQTQLAKNIRLSLTYLDCFRVETKKGFHVYLLTEELLPNKMLYHVDKFGERRIIGSIQSKGKYVVGFDSPDKQLVENGRWFWHVKDLAQVQATLAKFFVEVGKEKIQVAEEKPTIIEEKVPKLVLDKSLKEPKSSGFSSLDKHPIQAKILAKQKTNLPNLWKVFCRNQITQQTCSFLVNDYQKPEALPNLDIGAERSIMLISGLKHRFFSRFGDRVYEKSREKPVWRSKFKSNSLDFGAV